MMARNVFPQQFVVPELTMPTPALELRRAASASLTLPFRKTLPSASVPAAAHSCVRTPAFARRTDGSGGGSSRRAVAHAITSPPRASPPGTPPPAALAAGTDARGPTTSNPRILAPHTKKRSTMRDPLGRSASLPIGASAPTVPSQTIVAPGESQPAMRWRHVHGALTSSEEANGCGRKLPRVKDEPGIAAARAATYAFWSSGFSYPVSGWYRHNDAAAVWLAAAFMKETSPPRPASSCYYEKRVGHRINALERLSMRKTTHAREGGQQLPSQELRYCGERTARNVVLYPADGIPVIPMSRSRT